MFFFLCHHVVAGYCADTDDGASQSVMLVDWLEAKLNSILSRFRGNAVLPDHEAESVAGGNEEVDGERKKTDLGDSGIETKDDSVVSDEADDVPKPVCYAVFIHCET